MLLFSTDIDGTVYDGPDSAKVFSTFWKDTQKRAAAPLLVYNSGRSLADTLQLLESTHLPDPHYLISGVGTEIFDFQNKQTLDDWNKELFESWDFDTVKRLVQAAGDGIQMQPDDCQNPFKCSWFWKDRSAEEIQALATLLQNAGIKAQIVYSSDRDLDVIPERANKGNALRWLAVRLGIPLEQITVAGDSGNDASMFLLEGVRGILVANAETSLIEATADRNVVRSSLPCVAGVIAALPYEKTENATAGTIEIPDNLYLVHLSIHGLIRGEHLELGRDADTGGQCRYVVELVKALAQHKKVGQVDLFTRRVVDSKVSPDYAEPVEDLGGGAFIRRIQAGPRRYLRKESLWRYLDEFVDQSLALFRQNNRLPDVIHAHYADAGYVGSRLASLLGCPFIFTGHSLGRTKRKILLRNQTEPHRFEESYNLAARIEAEELSLETAAMVCTSTHQEVEDQYRDYEHYDPARMKVIPPGVDLSRFSPAGPTGVSGAVAEKIERFLDHPDRPAILTIARADEKKNLASLVRAYGESSTLRNDANLVLVAGNRERISDLNPGARKVWSELLQLIDDYDLYGSVAIPKNHRPDEIPDFYRYAASKRGLFVNPALTEPFGLTIIEAAASGLPLLATNDGGPRDILGNCKNGVLIEPLDIPAMTIALEEAIADPVLWDQRSQSGLDGVNRHYTWKGHVDRYLIEASSLLEEITRPHLINEKIRTSLPLKDRIIFTGLQDEITVEDKTAITKIREMVDHNQPGLGFGIATGRSIEMARSLVQESGLPEPDVYITQLGGAIHYGKRGVLDLAWERHLAHRWEPETIHSCMKDLSGLVLQEEEGHQHHFKISYHYDRTTAPPRREIQRLLRGQNISAKVILSGGRFLDIIPLRSGKGQAIRYLSMKWGIPMNRTLFHARRGSDYEALSGRILAVLPSNHNLELSKTRKLPSVYTAATPGFVGLLEGITAYQFDKDIQVPESARGSHSEEKVDFSEAVLSPDLLAHTSNED